MLMKSEFKYQYISFIFVTLFSVTLILMEGDAFAFRRQSKAVVTKPAPTHGKVVKLPAGHKTVLVRGVKHFYYGGIFYKRGPSGFIVVKAPIGAVVVSLPVGHITDVIRGVNYYYYGGVYYQKIPSGYVVVEAPSEVVVVQGAPPTIPSAKSVDSVTVTAKKLNVRSGPGMNFQVIHQINYGDALEVHGNAPGWLYAELPSGKYGWVREKFTAQVVQPASG